MAGTVFWNSAYARTMLSSHDSVTPSARSVKQSPLADELSGGTLRTGGNASQEAEASERLGGVAHVGNRVDALLALEIASVELRDGSAAAPRAMSQRQSMRSREYTSVTYVPVARMGRGAPKSPALPGRPYTDMSMPPAAISCDTVTNL